MPRSHSSRGPASLRRRSDLRYAGFISAGMIATVLTLAALVAPLLAWNGAPGQNARERSQTIRLSELAARAVGGPFTIDRSTPIAAAAAGRLFTTTAAGDRTTAERRAARESRGTSERVGVSLPAHERTASPRRTSPLANATGDSDA